MTTIYTFDYSICTHVVIMEGKPLSYLKEESKEPQLFYPTTDSSIFFVSIRKGFMVYHYYVHEHRAIELIREKQLNCESYHY